MTSMLLALAAILGVAALAVVMGAIVLARLGALPADPETIGDPELANLSSSFMPCGARQPGGHTPDCLNAERETGTYDPRLHVVELTRDQLDRDTPEPRR